MTFTTLSFVIFLAFVFALYWGLKDNSRQKLLLVISGYFFYGWWDYRFCSLMLASTLVDYSFGRLLSRAEKRNCRRLLLAASCAFNLGLLGAFKYWNFFAESAGELFRLVGWRLDMATVHVILPVGISFYTFQSMSYIFDVYRREVEPTRNLLDYMAYVSFFPQLLAGPIERGKRLLPQFQRERRFDEAMAVDGLRLILWGFFKKMVIADNLAVCVDQAYAHPGEFDGFHLAFATVCFAFQIYGDFSGYSDIAVGTAQLFGFNLMRNFAYPYFAQSMGEFWRRWHISLSSWFRDYVYVPLGGSRVSRARLAGNVMTTFLLSGLWHGAAWTYVAWGALNGLGTLPSVLRRKAVPSVSRLTSTSGLLPHPRAALWMAGTFLFTCFCWVFFRARTFDDAFLILGRIFSLHFYQPTSRGFDTFLSTKGTVALLFAFVVIEWICRERVHPLGWERLPRALRWSGYTALIWFTLYLGPLHPGNFIYFQF